MTATARPDRAANYRQRQERTAPIDWAAASAAAAQVLLGEPNPRLSSSRQRRWGSKGSLALNLNTGFWQDYEAANGGGTLQLITRETGCSPQEAMEWLVERGIIPPRPEGPPPAPAAAAAANAQKATRPPATSPATGNAASSPPARAAASDPYPAPPEPDSSPLANAATTSEQAQRLWAKGEPLPDPSRLPAPLEAWLQRRQLWPAQLPLPTALRWHDLPPSHAPAVGQLLVLLAPPEHWQAAWPALPPAQALQLLTLDANGRPAPDKPPPAPPLDKRNLGPSSGALLLLGNPCCNQPEVDLQLAEGVADALAIAARRPGPTLAVLGAGNLGSPRLEQWLAASPWRLLIYADGDRPGRQAAQRLHRRRQAAGQDSQLRQPNFQAKDPAAASALARPLAVTPADLNKALQEISREYPAWPEWERKRQARLRCLPPMY